MTRSEGPEEQRTNSIEHTLSRLVEALAEIEHQRWAHWQTYVHSNASRQDDGSLVIPASLASHWERLIATPYQALTEQEKASDREQVQRYMPLIIGAIESARSDA